MVIITANEGTETRRLSEKEENVSSLQVAVGFSFTSDWLRGLLLDIFFSITAYLCGVAIDYGLAGLFSRQIGLLTL